MPLHSLFSTYRHLENQMTNALAQTLGRDSQLAIEFATYFTSQRLGSDARVDIQARPIEMARWYPNLAETPDATRPDAWIVSAKGVVAIESKAVVGALREDQLLGHCRRLPEQGSLLVLTPDAVEPDLVGSIRERVAPHLEVVWRSWADVYGWAAATSLKVTRPVARLLLDGLRSYLESLDMIGFAGIDLPEGYDYLRAKAILRALAQEVSSRIRVDYPAFRPRRKAIADDRSFVEGVGLVWMPLGPSDDFTSAPHFTLAIYGDYTQVALTVPNSARPSWPRLKEAAKNGTLSSRIDDFVHAVRDRPVRTVRVELYQRRWPQRRARPEMVGFLEQSLSDKDPHPLWRQTLLDALATGVSKGNWELQLGVEYENGSPIIRTKAFADEVASVLREMKPLMTLVAKP